MELSLRASSLPRVKACPASAWPAEHPADFSAPEARLGSALHAAMALRIQGGNGDWPAALLASRYGVEEDQLSILMHLAWPCWESLAEFFPRPSFEEELKVREDGLELTGHVDLLSRVADASGSIGEVHLLDWKSGHVDSSHTEQLKAYSFLALRNYPAAERIAAVTVRIREGTSDRADYSRAELEEWWQELRDLIERGPRWNPGAACKYCPHALACGPRSDFIAEVLRVMLDYASVVQTLFRHEFAFKGDELASLWEWCGQIEGLAAQVRQLVKADLANAGTPLQTSDGRAISLELYSTKAVDFGRALPVLHGLPLQEEELYQCITLSTTKLEKVLANNYPRGSKGKAIEALRQQLEHAGALIQHEHAPKVSIKRIS